MAKAWLGCSGYCPRSCAGSHQHSWRSQLAQDIVSSAVRGEGPTELDRFLMSVVRGVGRTGPRGMRVGHKLHHLASSLGCCPNGLRCREERAHQRLLVCSSCYFPSLSGTMSAGGPFYRAAGDQQESAVETDAGRMCSPRLMPSIAPAVRASQAWLPTVWETTRCARLVCRHDLPAVRQPVR